MTHDEKAIVPYQDIERMGVAIAKSNLFGMKTPEQAVALMLVAQAQGRHPATVAMEYDIIQNKPALKSQAALMRFQEAGGQIEYVTRTDAEVSARFTHPAGGTILVTWNMDRARKMGFAEKDNWKKQPMIMLQWRVVAEGVRACFPACLGGSYLVEEVQDFDTPKKAELRNVTPHTPPATTEETPQTMTPEAVAESVSGTVIDHETGEVTPADSATAPQLRAIEAILTKLGVKDDFERHERVSKAIKLPNTILSMKDLSKSQASEAIKTLGSMVDK